MPSNHEEESAPKLTRREFAKRSLIAVFLVYVAIWTYLFFFVGPLEQNLMAYALVPAIFLFFIIVCGFCSSSPTVGPGM